MHAAANSLLTIKPDQFSSIVNQNPSATKMILDGGRTSDLTHGKSGPQIRRRGARQPDRPVVSFRDGCRARTIGGDTDTRRCSVSACSSAIEASAPLRGGVPMTGIREQGRGLAAQSTNPAPYMSLYVAFPTYGSIDSFSPPGGGYTRGSPRSWLTKEGKE